MRVWAINKLKRYYRRSARHQKEFIYLLENHTIFWHYTLLEFICYICGISLVILGIATDIMEIGIPGLTILIVGWGMGIGSNYLIAVNLKKKEMKQ